jgi:hypothetical protein
MNFIRNDGDKTIYVGEWNIPLKPGETMAWSGAGIAMGNSPKVGDEVCMPHDKDKYVVTNEINHGYFIIQNMRSGDLSTMHESRMTVVNSNPNSANPTPRQPNPPEEEGETEVLVDEEWVCEIPAEEHVALNEASCAVHSWVMYTGLTEQFEYCEDCGIKMSDYYEDLKSWGSWWGI